MDSFTIYQSPVGKLLLRGNNQGLLAIQFPEHSAKPTLSSDGQSPSYLLEKCMAQLDAYFSGQLKAFNLPLMISSTPFQEEVLAALQQIPYGQSCSYSHIATQVGNPQAARAVGGAAHRNPIPIIIPCHRVIGANGQLTGFAPGLKIKKYLLDLEKQYR